MGKLALMGVLVLSSSAVWAMDGSETPEEIINQEMCRRHNHHYDVGTKECVYCAQHLKYNKSTNVCKGELSPLGKCYGSDHFHAATLECMYCAKGFEFNEDTRKCDAVDASQEK